MQSNDNSTENLRNISGKRRRLELGDIVPDGRPRRLRWIRLLKDLADAHNTAWLEQGIQQANPPRPEWVVDDEKLAELMTRTDGKVRLTVNQIIALDRFFSQFGEGIQEQGLFERSILEPAAHAGSVRFVLGSSSDRDELWNVVRRWDSQAMAEILREVTQINARVKIEIADVIRNGADKPPHYPYKESRSAGRSIIAIGSPLANPYSETLLAEMIGVPAFGRAAVTNTALPFQFIWAAMAKPPYHSTFAVKAKDQVLKRVRRQIKGYQQNHGVLLANLPNQKEPHKLQERFYESVRLQESGPAPGVIVAQQRATGEVYMVVAGVSGPGTYAAAKYLASHRTYSLPQRQLNKHGKVLVLYVQAKVSRKHHHRGDECDVGEPESMGSLAWPLDDMLV
jgi:hypothetical protein